MTAAVEVCPSTLSPRTAICLFSAGISNLLQMYQYAGGEYIYANCEENCRRKALLILQGSPSHRGDVRNSVNYLINPCCTWLFLSSLLWGSTPDSNNVEIFPGWIHVCAVVSFLCA